VNVWITYPPFVWLPAVMVLTALAAHLLIFRAVRERTRD
jgi:heme exporter protein D